MPDLGSDTTRHTRTIRRFNSWAEGQGGDVLPLTNEYELTRIQHADGTFVIYRNAKDALNFSDSTARKAWKAFKSGSRFRLNRRHRRTKSEKMVERIIARDGDVCFFCWEKFASPQERTIEHLLAISHGGNNKLANLVLAHEYCNQQAGSLDIMQKIGLREQNRPVDHEPGGMLM